MAMWLFCSISGLVMILFGSLIACAAPGDGQTAMFCYPLWFFGGSIGGYSLYKAFALPLPRWFQAFVIIFAILSVAFLIFSINASIKYTASLQKEHSETKPK